MSVKRAFEYFLFFLFFSFFYPKASFAYADLILIEDDFDTCWEIYEDSGKGERWKVYLELPIKNQGDQNVSHSKVKIIFPTGGGGVDQEFTIFGPESGETLIIKQWFFFPNTFVAGQWAGAFCKILPLPGDQGFWSTAGDCKEAKSVRIILDYGGKNYLRTIDVSDKWPTSETRVPGHYYYSCSGSERFTPTPAPNVYLTYEAESGSITLPMVKVYDPAVSDCFYLHSPDVGGSGQGAVNLQVNIPQSRNYYLWGRRKGADYSGDSFFVSWDGGAETRWGFNPAGPSDWQWERVKDASGGNPSWPLAAGWHTLKIRTSEDGSQIDAVGISNDFNWTPDFFQPCFYCSISGPDSLFLNTGGTYAGTVHNAQSELYAQWSASVGSNNFTNNPVNTSGCADGYCILNTVWTPNLSLPGINVNLHITELEAPNRSRTCSKEVDVITPTPTSTPTLINTPTPTNTPTATNTPTLAPTPTSFVRGWVWEDVGGDGGCDPSDHNIDGVEIFLGSDPEDTTKGGGFCGTPNFSFQIPAGNSEIKYDIKQLKKVTGIGDYSSASPETIQLYRVLPGAEETINFRVVRIKPFWFQAQGGGIQLGESLNVSVPSGQGLIVKSGGLENAGALVVGDDDPPNLGEGTLGDAEWLVNNWAPADSFDINYFKALLDMGTFSYHETTVTSLTKALENIINVCGGGPCEVSKTSSEYMINSNKKLVLVYDDPTINPAIMKFTIDCNVAVPEGSFFALFSRGPATVEADVTQLEGIYFSEGNFIVEDDGLPGDGNIDQLTIAGLVAANGSVSVRRDLGKDNRDNPAVVFSYRPDLIMNMPQKLWRKKIKMEEILP